ncbi:MAG: PD-(D/E)XK motif protein [Ruminococcus sp.]|nr:PD-(D/E)XK motif protein [Ruminococcus sp.]
MTTIELDKLWKSITFQSGNTVARRIDSNHPLDFFVSYDENGNMQIVLLSDILPNIPASSKEIQVRANERSDGKYAICFSLLNRSFSDLFVSLCWDLVKSTYNTKDYNAGVNAALGRFVKWQNLFDQEKRNELSTPQLKGLIGELYVLKNICIPKYTVSTSIESWMGPLFSDRDFSFDDMWYEVKAASLSVDHVKISSLDQLDTDNPGMLVICRIENASSSEQGGFSLNELVNDIIVQIGDDQRIKAIFQKKLSLYGYDRENEQSYDTYIISDCEIYTVDDGFPRIRRSKLPSAIVNGTYDLSISGIQDWNSSR